MPHIIPSSMLRNQYNEISREAHQSPEPIYVTKNGSGDLAVMSIEAFENLTRRAELVDALKQGHRDVKAGHTVEAHEALRGLRNEFA